ncbi:unnamed protein product, partial [Iphiclides podalirius]
MSSLVENFCQPSPQLEGLGRLHPYGSGSGSSDGSGRRRTRPRGPPSPTAPTTPTSASDNASDATLTDSELPLARDSTLLVQNGAYRSSSLRVLIYASGI